MHTILADILNSAGEPDHHNFFDPGPKVALDFMIHFGLPIAWREHFHD